LEEKLINKLSTYYRIALVQMAQVVDTADIKNSDGSVSVKNPAFNIEIDKTVVQANGNEEDDGKKKKRLRRREINYQAEVTCRKTCGWQVLAIGLLILLVAAFHLVVMFLFLKNGKTFNDRPAVSIFLVLSILFMLIIVLFLVLWKKKVKRWVKRKFEGTSSSARRSGEGMFGNYRWYIDNCGLDGKYYLKLWRFHIGNLTFCLANF
jgi:hypothetical protein